MHAWEFFLPEETTAPDPFGWPAPPPVAQVDTALLERLLVGPDASRGDIEVAVALARFVHQEYAAFATEGSALTPDDSRLALRSLSAVLDRSRAPGSAVSRFRHVQEALEDERSDR